MAQSALASAKSGLTTAQRDANTISIQQAQQAVTTDEQQLATDQTALATAQAQLARDAKLGFPATSTTSSGSASTGSGSTGEQRVRAARSTRLRQRVHGHPGSAIHRRSGQRVHRSRAAVEHGIGKLGAPARRAPARRAARRRTARLSARCDARSRDWRYRLAPGRRRSGRPDRQYRFRVGGWHVVCDVERERDAGRAGYDLLLRVRHLADESELDHSDR